MEPDYFIKAIEHAEAKRSEEIERIETGAVDADEETRRQENQNEEWERL
jgi:hypothetical protein